MTHVKSIGIVGGGNMGSGIAQKYATHGFKVTLIDLNEDTIKKSSATIENMVEQGVKRQIFSAAKAAQILANLRFSASLNDVAENDLVIEAIFEDLQAKQALFQELEAIVKNDTILATNTSSFLLKDISSKLKFPERFLGLHYFFHPAKNRLVEVVRGPKTNNEFFLKAFALQETIKKIPLATVDSPGFVVNRFFVPWLNEAAILLESGRYSIKTIEEAAKLFFGVGMGPFELMNVTGTAIAFHALNSLCDNLGAFYKPSPLIEAAVKNGTKFSLEGEVCTASFKEIGLKLLLTTVSIAQQMAFNEKIASVAEVDLGARVGLLWPKGPFELYYDHHQEIALIAKECPRIPSLMKTSSTKLDLGFVSTEIKESVGIITLNRPDSLNALSEKMLEMLENAFDDLLRQSTIHGIILQGSGRAFMAGADLRFFEQNLLAQNLANILSFTQKGQALFKKIDDAAVPVIALIDGLALGGGLELALCADYILASKRAVMGFPETSIGIYPGLGGTQRSVHRVGPSIARYLILSGVVLSAEEALSLGLIDEIGDENSLCSRAMTIINNVGEMHFKKHTRAAQKNAHDIVQAFSRPFALLANTDSASDRVKRALDTMKRNAPIALKISDELITLAEQVPLHEGLDRELEYLPQIFSTSDAKNGIYATRKKEKVVFEGR